MVKVVFLVYHQKRGFTAFLLAVRSNYKEIIKVLEVHEEKENESWKLKTRKNWEKKRMEKWSEVK